MRARHCFPLEGQKTCVLVSRARVVQKCASVVHGHRVKTQQRWSLLLFSGEPPRSMWCFPIPRISGEALLAKGVCFHQQASPKPWTLSMSWGNASNSRKGQQCQKSLFHLTSHNQSSDVFIPFCHLTHVNFPCGCLWDGSTKPRSGAGTMPLEAFWVQGKNSGLSSYRLRSPCCSYCSSFPRKAESGKNFPLFSQPLMQCNVLK